MAKSPYDPTRNSIDQMIEAHAKARRKRLASEAGGLGKSGFGATQSGLKNSTTPISWESEWAREYAALSDKELVAAFNRLVERGLESRTDFGDIDMQMREELVARREMSKRGLSVF